MKGYTLIALLFIFSCVKKQSSQNQISEFPIGDTISAIYYEDNSLKQIKLKDNKVKVFYRNGNLFKEGFVDENDELKGQWHYYTLEGKISELREFNNFSGVVSLNRSIYYIGDLDSMIMEKDPYFNKYNQKEFVADTLPYDISMYTKFELGKDTIKLNEPWRAATVRYIQAFLNKDVNIAVVLGDFDKDFSNIAEVKKDTFYNLLKDVDNQKWFPEENPATTVVFGRWFDSVGEKTIRGYLTEYYKVDSTLNKESRVYFEKRLYVKDSIE